MTPGRLGFFELDAGDGEIGIVGQDALDDFGEAQRGLGDDADAWLDFDLSQGLEEDDGGRVRDGGKGWGWD